MDQRYFDYLQSDWWKKTRDEAIERAGNKCFCCDRPFDLQVHHLTYDHLGFERDYELVVLCKTCHRWIEEHKRYQVFNETLTRTPQEQMELLKSHRVQLHNTPDCTVKTSDELMTEFGKTYYFRDYSQGGDLNLTKLDVLKEEFPKFCEQNHYIYVKPSWTTLIDFFRNRRYEVILRFKDKGATMADVMHQTKFNDAMIRKVWNKPEIYRRLLEGEKLNE